ncbi:MAG: PAS domain S-box protein [Desulfovibrionales bacterium]
MRFCMKSISASLFFFLLLFCAGAHAKSHNHRHVLLLHSYHSGMTWVQNIEKAVYDVLDPDKNDIILHIEYLDSKRAHSEEHYRQFAHLLEAKYRDIDLSLIMSSDNNAFDLVLGHKKELFPRIPFVFCGVNDFQPEMLEGLDNVTGVAEYPSAAETMRTMLRLKPDTKKVYVINDYLTTGRAWTRQIRNELEQFKNRVQIEYNRNLPIQELQGKIRSLPPGSMVLLGVYYADKTGDYFTYEKVGAELTNTSPVPVFCLLRFNLHGGVVGGKVIDGYSQGKIMAETAVRILNGEPPGNIPVIHAGANRFIFDSRALAEYQMPESRLPAGSILINAPFSFYNEYKNLVWITAALIAVLLTLILLLLKNIYSRKKVEEQLRKSETKYRSIFNNANEGIFQSTPEGVPLDANPAMAHMLGYSTKSELLNNLNDISQQVYEDSFDRVFLKKELAGSDTLSNWDVKLKKRDGSVFWASLNIHRVEDAAGRFPVYYEGTVNDITRRKADELALLEKDAELVRHRDNLEKEIEKRTRELKQSEARFKTLFDASADAIVTIKNGKYVDCNQAALELLGIRDKADFLNTSPEKWAPEKQPDGSLSAEKQWEMMDRAFKNGTHRFEWTRYKADGCILPLEVQLTALHDYDGQLVLIAAWRDLTGKKRAEAEIARSNDLMQNVLDAATQVSIIATDRHGLINVFNSGAERMLGYRAEEVIGRQTPELFHLDSEINEHARYLSREYGEDIDGFEVFVARARHGGYDEQEWTYVRKDGSHLIVNLAVTAIFDAAGKIKLMLGVAMDITRKKQFEKELLKLEKLKSVGSLAGGIAHDFNNVLVGIFGNISLAEDKLEEGHPAGVFLARAERAMHRASRLTGKLLTFATGGQPVKNRVSLREVVQIVALEFSGGNVRPVFDFEDGLWTANVDKTQIEEVFSNLIKNAEQAMPDGGLISISLQNAEISQDEIPHLRPGKYIKAEVRDQGVGLESEYASQIFDPYFTTRNQGQGLGLAAVQSIIVQHGGIIEVESEVGKGSVFTFYLPAGEKENGQNGMLSSSQKREEGRVLRILVMDDEEMIREFTRELLEEEGHEVVDVPDGEQAVRVYRDYWQAGTPFDVVLMDLSIPGGLGGRETIGYILEIDPNARCVVCSGYASDPILSNYREYGFRAMLAKPHTAEELKNALARVTAG